jgi:hypothetical protein
VNLDGCVEVEAAYYSAPPGWIGRAVQVQWDAAACACSIRAPANCCANTCASKRGAIASRSKTAPRTRPRTTQQLLARCAQDRPHAGALAEHMYRQDGPLAIRRIQGLLGLARKHGAALTDDACAAALEIRRPLNPYRFVRRWLERRPQLTLRQVDPIIRQLTLYRDLIDNKNPGEQPE